MGIVMIDGVKNGGCKSSPKMDGMAHNAMQAIAMSGTQTSTVHQLVDHISMLDSEKKEG